MKKIINITTPSYFPEVNGLSFVVQRNVQALLELGYHVNVLSGKGTKSVSAENVYCFNIKGNGRLFNSIKGEKDKYIACLIELSKTALLNICHGWHSWSTNLALDSKGIIESVIYVYSHGVGYSTYEPFFRQIARGISYFFEKKNQYRYMDVVDGMIFITKEEEHPRCQDFVRFQTKGKPYYILENTIIERNIVEDEKKAIENEITEFLKEGTIAVNLSNYEHTKNQFFLIKILRSFEKLKIIFIGSKNNNYYCKLMKYAKKLNVQNRILFLYNKTDICIDYILKNSSFFLFASKNDFAPLVLIEANKYKLPFISFYTADTKRKGGIFCRTANDYYDKVDHFLTMKSEDLKQMGEQGKEYYYSHNSYSVYRERIKKIMSKIDDCNTPL